MAASCVRVRRSAISMMNMRRWLARIARFAALGAIVTCAIAWASSLSMTAPFFLGIIFDTPEEIGVVFQDDRRTVSKLARYSGATWAIVGIERDGPQPRGAPIDRPWFMPEPLWHDPEKFDSRQFIDDDGVTIWLVHGWPLPALRGAFALGRPSPGRLSADAGTRGLLAMRWVPESRAKGALIPQHYVVYEPIWTGLFANAAIFATALAALFVTLRAVRRCHRRRRGRCPHCGYDQRASSTPICPECGDASGALSAIKS
jgi:hypothetical protein